jgi:CheY-like chemotaxis protein
MGCCILLVDGLSLAKRLRLDKRPEVRALPLVLLASDKSHNVRERSLEAGRANSCENHLVCSPAM